MSATNKAKQKRAMVARELEKIRKRGRGIIKPAAVVEAARDPKHPLHSCFEWDDAKAGHSYRLWQARQLIVTVTVEVAEDTHVQAHVHIARDSRTSGYRLVSDVMSDDEMREELLNEAREDMNTFRRRYAMLRELAEVFAAMEKV